MVKAADQNCPGAIGRILDLCMTSQAKIGIVLNEHFAIDGAVRVVA